MKGKAIVILQSNYLPWKGYFDLMAAADEFLLFDEVQFTKNDWRNRNRIVLGGRLHWLTLPVRTAGKLGAAIHDMEVAKAGWACSHWEKLRQAYRGTPFFSDIAPVLKNAYTYAPTNSLSAINEHFLRTLMGLLRLDTAVLHASIVPRTTDEPSRRLIEICRARGATAYISGPAARKYLDVVAFHDAGIEVYYADYTGYPAYQQGCTPFEHGVSMVDTLMQCGVAARQHLKSLSQRPSFLVPA
jgi:hypothetical protein